MFKAGKIIKIFIVLFVVFVAIIWIVNSYVSQGILKDFKNSSPSEQINTLEEMKDENSDTEIEKVFISPDGIITFDYSSGWQQIEEKSILKEIIPEKTRESYSLEILFLAHRLKDQKYNQTIIVNKAILKKGEEVIDSIKEMNSEEERKMEIIESTIKETENKIDFEALYIKENSPDLHSRERVIILNKDEEENYIYLVSFVCPDEKWENSKEKAEEVIGSVRLAN